MEIRKEEYVKGRSGSERMEEGQEEEEERSWKMKTIRRGRAEEVTVLMGKNEEKCEATNSNSRLRERKRETVPGRVACRLANGPRSWTLHEMTGARSAILSLSLSLSHTHTVDRGSDRLSTSPYAMLPGLSILALPIETHTLLSLSLTLSKEERRTRKRRRRKRKWARSDARNLLAPRLRASSVPLPLLPLSFIRHAVQQLQDAAAVALERVGEEGKDQKKYRERTRGDSEREREREMVGENEREREREKSAR